MTLLRAFCIIQKQFSCEKSNKIKIIKKKKVAIRQCISRLKRKRPNLLYIRRNFRFFKCQIKIKWQNAQCMQVVEILMSTKEEFLYATHYHFEPQS